MPTSQIKARQETGRTTPAVDVKPDQHEIYSTADLPIRTRWGFEAATVIVKHGGGLPTDWIKFQQGRDFVDLINFGMLITIEFGDAGH